MKTWRLRGIYCLCTTPSALEWGGYSPISGVFHANDHLSATAYSSSVWTRTYQVAPLVLFHCYVYGRIYLTSKAVGSTWAWIVFTIEFRSSLKVMPR
jgi:hypothetical protein